MKLAKRVEQIKLSSIVKIADKVRELEKKGEKVIRLETGEPHFATPSFIKEAAINALKKDLTHYSHSRGFYDLRKALCDYYNHKYKTNFDANQNILITPGGKQAVFYAILCEVEKGDEVIISTPAWVSYEEIVRLAEGKPIFAVGNKNKDFKIEYETIRKKITKRTKAIILNSPNNPTGRIISQKDLEKISDICVRRNILLIADEIYGDFVFTGNVHRSVLAINPSLRNCILINGFSKSYAMTGWRLGYVLAESYIIEAMLKLQQNSITCPTTFIQDSALVAVEKGKKFIEDMVRVYQVNRDLLIEEFKKIKKLRMIEPQGGLYAFIDISQINKDSKEFCADLLDKARVSAVPGVVFGKGGEGFIRVSLATEKKNIVEFIKRLKQTYGV